MPETLTADMTAMLPRPLEDPYAYLIVTDDGVDQVCETRKDADREMLALRDDSPMLVVVPWEEQDEYVDYYNAPPEEEEWDH